MRLPASVCGDDPPMAFACGRFCLCSAGNGVLCVNVLFRGCCYSAYLLPAAVEFARFELVELEI